MKGGVLGCMKLRQIWLDKSIMPFIIFYEENSRITTSEVVNFNRPKVGGSQCACCVFFSVFISNLETQSTVCRHSPAGFHDGSGSCGSRLCLQSQGEQVKYISLCGGFYLALFNTKIVTQQISLITLTQESKGNVSDTDYVCKLLEFSNMFICIHLF